MKKISTFLPQYPNRWIFAAPITVNSMESFPLINTVSNKKGSE